ncbi:MAG: SH3 domain-containing protein [Candidatus Riflebacteria bacterium]|nr:SH3 domain-containing protein [Candidatus Riflebacteria bacterium]
MKIGKHGKPTGILFSLAFLLIVFTMMTSAAQAHHHDRCYVVPTYYGYGIIGRPAYGWALPYVVTPYSVAPGYVPYATYNRNYYGPYYGYPGYPGYSNPYGIPYNYSSSTEGYAHSGSTLGQVVTASLNVRSTPGKAQSGDSDSNVIGVLAQGERVWVLGSSGDWFLVQSADGRPIRGYVHGGYIQAINGNNTGISSTSPYTYSVGMARYYGDPRGWWPPRGWH